ncbi:UDP-N-acetyl-D-glucosamine 2-epimerase, UDP-hydrolysing [Candidatus Giovannonibacteria bacterium RIFCSPHIGHO2_01_FULL_48_47]|nr:MAG: UDP-N-acetyl-D-glucosamine 2-epimerase, UDP-hydrolysing [Candidatus Giovannonibacteria bacterium RIFCSPHIGHO2_01_FULL_48_47]OGF68394.1 MAG: UDP-N-acetyl-D-glucosamine 2-epimerase, UDP-hydrolysing [Candidatus Giovannonibacteria bacterium RIFCSPHIGHO2_02_FULL_48_15]OGF89697.1 MAG: UDP-N-acetyl-D-glucosamine 2-epimerase, UDP-hydrolysing [Candidatus Giovannonibacteria bacterium RIFCSPLOWO2_01_FULL_48_47]OGF96151.1 MAG: UDP-N-acetyl-D-glucosamine 2-epimerase, UDP-hydrolysing [Candidatus Giova
MRKICAITANRADFSRMESALIEIKNHPDLELQLVVMGSHLLEKTGRTAEEIKRKGFDADWNVQMELEGGNPVSMTKSVGLAIIELTTALEHLRPDVVLVPVDRFESLAMGVAAALLNIHVAHIQGGEVTGTIDESIRHALSKLSHLHLVATEKSRERVIKMGEPEENVFNVGCPGTDLILRVPPLNREEVLTHLNKEVIKGPEKFDPEKPYLLVVQHPVTTEFGSEEKQIIETLEALKKFDEQVLMLWPNIDAGSDAISKIIRKYLATHFDGAKSNVLVLKHIPHELFVNLLRNASGLIGNSSSGIREACYFGLPVVNIGSRQQSRERGSNVLDASCERNDIENAIRRQLSKGRWPAEYIYGNGTAGKQIAEILATIKLPDIQKKITY